MSIIDIVFKSQSFFNHLDFMAHRFTMKLLFSNLDNLFSFFFSFKFIWNISQNVLNRLDLG